MNIHNEKILWITPVEKPVQIVENSELSTGIALIFPVEKGCGELCIVVCIEGAFPADGACYVTKSRKPVPIKTGRKSLQIVKMRCHFLYPFEQTVKNL